MITIELVIAIGITIISGLFVYVFIANENKNDEIDVDYCIPPVKKRGITKKQRDLEEFIFWEVFVNRTYKFITKKRYEETMEFSKMVLDETRKRKEENEKNN